MFGTISLFGRPIVHAWAPDADDAQGVTIPSFSKQANQIRIREIETTDNASPAGQIRRGFLFALDYNQNMAKKTIANDDSSKARAYAVCFVGGLLVVMFSSFADDWLMADLLTDPVAVERINRIENGHLWLHLPFRLCQIGGVVYMVTAAILEVRRRLRRNSQSDST